MSTKLAWIEIPAIDIERAVRFYEGILEIKLEVRTLFGTRVALLDKKDFGINGCIIANREYNGADGIRPVFRVTVIGEALDKVSKLGGLVLSEPELLKQKNERGENVIGSNLIDNNIGYMASIRDSEGNYLFLYSNS